MKTVMKLLFTAGLVLGGIYLYGGYHSYDPEKQAQQARAAIKPGMSLMQVVKAAPGTPRIQHIIRFSHTDRGQTLYENRPGNPVDFDYDQVQKQLKAKEMPQGFQLLYNISLKTAFSVVFDENGKVVDIQDERTMADLLHTR